MPRMTVSELLTLDGVLQPPGLRDEDSSGGLSHGAASRPRRVRLVVDVPPEPLSRPGVDALYGGAVVAALEAPVSVLGGHHDASPVPADVCSRLAGDIPNADRRVVADLSGAPLDAVLEGRVDVLKVWYDGDQGPPRIAFAGRRHPLRRTTSRSPAPAR
jgi:hypothetical protein